MPQRTESPDVQIGDALPTPAPTEPPERRPLVERALPWAVIGIFLFSLFAILYATRAILLPVTLALLVSLVLTPVVRVLKKVGLPHVIAVILVLVGAVGLIGWGAYRLREPALMWFENAPEYLREIEYKLGFLKKPLEEIQSATEQISEATAVNGRQEPVPVRVEAPALSDTVLTFTGSALAAIVVLIVSLYFFLSTGDALFRRTIESLPRLREKKRAVEVAREIERGISTYLFSIAVINIALGAAVGAALWALGMPNPVLWGVMAAAFNFIPYLGAMVGTIIVGLVAIVSFDSLGYALLAPASYLLINTLEGNVITPSILGRRFDMNPLLIFLWLLLWGWLWGVVGAIIAVPMLVAVKIFCDRLEPLQPIGHFLVR